MNPSKQNPDARPNQVLSSALASLLVCLVMTFCPAATNAGFTITIENSTSKAGSTGSFDVIVTNTGGTVPVSGFNVEIMVGPNSGVHFTSASVNTAPSTPYLFGTLQNGPLVDPSYTFSNTDFVASDFANSPISFVANATFGLEHVTYSVDPSTVGPTVLVNLVAFGTAISDPAGNSYVSKLQGGVITLTTSAVPEPTSMILVASGCIMVLASRRRRRSES